MAFIRIMEYRSGRPAEIAALFKEWSEATGDGRDDIQNYLCRDPRRDGLLLNVIIYPSREAADRNAARVETQALLGQRLMALMDGPPSMTELDVVQRLT